MENNAKEKNLKYFLKNHSLWIIIFILIILPIGYLNGYRLKNNLMIGKVGIVEIDLPYPNTSVYIDQSKKIVTSTENEKFSIKLSPKKHSVIVSREGMYPWTKNFVVPSNGKIKLYPIFIYLNPSGQIITNKDPEFYKIRNSIIYYKTPEELKPIISNDGEMEMWMNDNAIYAKKINDESEIYKVIQPDTVIRNVDFFKDRSDSIIFSTSNAIYVIEINASGTQNFMPIYKGVEPSFIRADENSIYVLDGSNLMQIII